MGTTKSLNKNWAGTFALVRTVTFSQAARKWRSAWSGEADVYSFQPVDPKCKVAYAAVIRGIPQQVMCSESGNVGAAILRAAGLAHAGKNSGVAGEYDTFPDPIGCPAARLQARDGVHALTFYRKTK